MPRTTAESVIIELLRESDGEWQGKTRLFKAFYFAHLYYAAQHPGRLTAWPIVRMPQGPGIHDSQTLLADLVAKGLITVESVHEGPYPEQRFRLADRGKAVASLPADAAHAIQKAADFCRDKTAAQLSQLTHEHSRSWQLASEGDVLDIELDLIPDDEYERRNARIDSLAKQLDEVLGSKKA